MAAAAAVAVAVAVLLVPKSKVEAAVRRKPAAQDSRRRHRAVVQDFLPEVASSKAARVRRPIVDALQIADLFEPAAKPAAAATAQSCASWATCTQVPVVAPSWAPPSLSLAVAVEGANCDANRRHRP